MGSGRSPGAAARRSSLSSHGGSLPPIAGPTATESVCRGLAGKGREDQSGLSRRQIRRGAKDHHLMWVIVCEDGIRTETHLVLHSPFASSPLVASASGSGDTANGLPKEFFWLRTTNAKR